MPRSMDAPAKQALPPAVKPPAPAASWATRGLLAVGVVFLLQAAKPVLVPVVVAVAFTFVLAPPVRWLRRHGVHESLGAAIVVSSVLTAAVMLGSTLANPAADWWDRAPTTVRQLITSIDHLRNTLLDATTGALPVVRKPQRTNLAPAAPPAAPRDPIAEKLASEGLTFTRVVIGQMLAFALSAAATVILLYFLLASEHWLVSRTVEAVPRRRTRALVLGGIRQAQREIGLFLGTMSLINVVLGAATGVALALIGLPNPVLWATTVAVLNFVPYLGPALNAVMLLLAGSMAFGADASMFAPPAIFLALHALEANFISPLVMGKRLRLSPIAVFLSVMVWGWIWGIAGALVAVPILLALRTVCKRSRRLRLLRVYLEGDATEPPSLHSLLRAKRRPSGRAAEQAAGAE
jgi:predicted PurR-regulated permease PerM